MLLETMDSTDFKRVFKKKFNSFCEKSPLFLSYSINDNYVVVKDSSGLMPDEFNYEINYLFTVENNIFHIRKHLSRFYPIFYVYIDETMEEIQKRIDNNETMEEILKAKKKKSACMLNKIINDSNELIVFNYFTKNLEALKLKIPVISFIQDLYSGKLSDNYKELIKLTSGKEEIHTKNSQ